MIRLYFRFDISARDVSASRRHFGPDKGKDASFLSFQDPGCLVREPGRRLFLPYITGNARDFLILLRIRFPVLQGSKISFPALEGLPHGVLVHLCRQTVVVTVLRELKDRIQRLIGEHPSFHGRVRGLHCPVKGPVHDRLPCKAALLTCFLKVPEKERLFMHVVFLDAGEYIVQNFRLVMCPLFR